MTTIRNYTKYLVYLCSCAISGKIPSEGFPKGVDFEIFFRFCLDHQLVGLAYDMLSKIKTGYEDTDIMRIFKDKHNYAVLKDASREYYLDLIRDAFCESKIDYALLKGSVIKDIYPLPYYRQSSDIDILIRSESAAQANYVMDSLGFFTKNYGEVDHTDNYQIDKYTFVELHKMLVQAKYDQFSSCNDIIHRLVLKKNHEYVMTVEDFYVFMVVHAAKHLKRSAVGIRTILDFFVYQKRYTNMNWKHINKELQKCSLTEFHSKLQKLVNYWFNGCEANSETLRIADYISSSGWNGRVEQVRAHEAKEINALSRRRMYVKLRYFFSVAFMNADKMKIRYPMLEKHPYLLPVYWMRRGVEVCLKRRYSFDQVVHAYNNIDMDELIQIDEMRNCFGL